VGIFSHEKRNIHCPGGGLENGNLGKSLARRYEKVRRMKNSRCSTFVRKEEREKEREDKGGAEKGSGRGRTRSPRVDTSRQKGKRQLLDAWGRLGGRKTCRSQYFKEKEFRDLSWDGGSRECKGSVLSVNENRN